MPIGLIKEYDVNIQSQTSPLFQYFLMNEQKIDISLTAPISMDDEIINVSAGHGFTAAAGEYIVVRNGDIFLQSKVTAVNVNAISIEIPVAEDYPISACVMRGNILMNVNGSVTPIDFKYTSTNCGVNNPVIPIDLSQAVLTMQHGTNVPDDGKFGGLTALTKGLYFRRQDGGRQNLGNYIMNQDFKDVGADVEYTTKAPAGTNGTNIVFDIENIFGQVIRMDPKQNDIILSKIRDNILPAQGMDKMILSIIGSYTRGE